MGFLSFPKTLCRATPPPTDPLPLATKELQNSGDGRRMPRLSTTQLSESNWSSLSSRHVVQGVQSAVTHSKSVRGWSGTQWIRTKMAMSSNPGWFGFVPIPKHSWSVCALGALRLLWTIDFFFGHLMIRPHSLSHFLCQGFQAGAILSSNQNC